MIFLDIGRIAKFKVAATGQSMSTINRADLGQTFATQQLGWRYALIAIEKSMTIPHGQKKKVI